MATEIVMPHMGEGVIEGTIARWLKAEGDSVEQYEPILEIETDKVTTEATAEVGGVLLQVLVPEGETVPVGTVLAYIGGADEAAPADDAASKTDAPAEAERSNGRKAAAPAPPIAKTEGNRRISPVVSRIAAEHRVDLSRVPGTGRDGRITKKDILAYVEERAAVPSAPVPAPAVTPAAPAPAPLPAPPAPRVAPRPVAGELEPHSSMRRAIAEHMLRSKRTSPHVTTVFEVDFTRVMAHRRAHRDAFARDGARLTFTPYLVAAIAQSLKEHPRVNSEWRDDGLMLHREIHIGMATAIDGGLIVPVIKAADSYNLLGLTRAINDLADRARSRQLRPEDVQGGTFSLTNHGTSGSLFATPIINQPQCGILGVGAIEKRVKVIDDAIAIRPLAYVSFTFDHRILDGASADAFVARFKALIETWG